MPPPMKRNFATSNLYNGTPTPSKRMRVAEAITLSSDSEPDAFNAHETRHSVASESADDNDAYLDGSQSSQIHHSRNVMEQLQQDAVDDFRADLCFELDCLREPAKGDAAENKTDSTEPLRDDDAVQGFRDVLRRWAEDERALRHTSHFYYRLDHKYDENQFPPPDGFRGRDLAVVEALDRVGGELDIEIFLALLDRDDNEPTPNYLVRSLVDQQGHELISYIPVDENNWVQTRLPSLKARAPDSEVAVVLIPRDTLVDFLMQYIEVPATSTISTSQIRSLEGVLGKLIAGISEPDNRGRHLPVLKELCNRIWQLDEAKGLALLPDRVVQGILKAVVNAEDWEFLGEVASHLGGRPPVGFFTWVADQAAAGSLPFPKIEKSILAAASTTTTFFNRLRIAYQLVAAQEPPKECKELARQLIAGLAEDVDPHGTCSYVGHFLVDLVCATQGPEGLESKLLPIVERNSAHTSFVLGILEGLRLRSPAQQALPSAPKGLFERVSQLLIRALDVSKLFQTGQHFFNDDGCVCTGGFYHKPTSAGAVDAWQLANTISELLANGADGLVASVACKIVADVELIPRQEYTSLWLPFLGHLIKVLEQHVVPLSTPRYRHLFAAILETYLIRCVGALPFSWAPKFKKVHCPCRVCRLFNRFLKSSIPAASFGALSNSELGHINGYLGPFAYKSHRCEFEEVAGVLVVRKVEEEDVQGLRSWRENMEKACINMGKLDGMALRAILGNDYSRIRNFHYNPVPRQHPPVPIESLDDPRNQSGPLSTPQTPASTAPAALASSAHRAYGSSGPSNTYGHAPSTNSPSTSSASPTRATPAHHGTSNVCATSSMKSNYNTQGPLLTPADSPHTLPLSVVAYNLFVDEFGARLRKLGDFTPQSIQDAISKEWVDMRPSAREFYVARAQSMRDSAGSTVPSPSVPFSPHKDRLPSTPKPSAHSPSFPSEPSRSQGSPNPAGGRAGSRSTWRGPRTPVSTATPRAAPTTVLPSSAASRAFGPVSSSRLNSMPTPRGYPEIKNEVVPKTTPRWGDKKVVDVIDLTGDD